MTIAELGQTMSAIGIIGMVVIRNPGMPVSVTLTTFTGGSDGRGATLLDALREALDRLEGCGRA